MLLPHQTEGEEKRPLFFSANHRHDKSSEWSRKCHSPFTALGFCFTEPGFCNIFLDI